MGTAFYGQHQPGFDLIGPIRTSPNSDLVAVASRDIKRARSYADHWDIPKAFGTYEAMLTDPGIDVIYNSLPNALHADWTVRAAEAGKHVLCEKPVVTTLQDMDRIERAAEHHDVMIFESFMYLHHPQNQRAHRIIEEGRLGELKLINSWFSFYLHPKNRDNIRLSAELHGGSMWDVGVYPSSMAITMADDGTLSKWHVEAGSDLRHHVVREMHLGDHIDVDPGLSKRLLGPHLFRLAGIGHRYCHTGDTPTVETGRGWQSHASDPRSSGWRAGDDHDPTDRPISLRGSGNGSLHLRQG